MKQITGVRKYSYLLPGMFSFNAFRLPAGFITGLFRMMHSEKLTLLGGRIYVNTHFAPLRSRSFDTAVSTMVSISRGMPRPEFVYVSLTDDCIFDCSYCSNYKNGRHKDAPADMLRILLKQVQDAGACCIGFTGGEPLLRNDLEEIIASVDERSYTVLFTSGYGLTVDRVSRLKESGLCIACVSLDSHDREKNNRGRGSDSAYDCAVEAVRLFSAAGVYTSVSAVLSGDGMTGNEIYDFVSFCGSLGAHEVRFLEAVPSGRISSAVETAGKSHRAELELLRRKINRDHSLPKLVLLSRMESPECFGCGAGWFHLYIDTAGNLCPCDFVQDKYGCLYDESFDVVYDRMHDSVKPFSSICLRERQMGNVVNDKMPLLMGKLIRGGRFYE